MGSKSPDSLPHTPIREHKDHPAAPPGPYLKKNQEQQACAGLGRRIQRPPHPFPQLLPKLSQPDKQTPWSDPGTCPLLGNSGANRLGSPSLALAFSLTSTIPPPCPPPPHHIGSHLLWQTASIKLLTPVVLIQEVTGDPSLANRRKEPSVCPSIYPSSPESQLVARSFMSVPRNSQDQTSSHGPNSTHKLPCTRKLGEPPLAGAQGCLQASPELRRLQPSIFAFALQGHLPFTERGRGRIIPFWPMSSLF